MFWLSSQPPNQLIEDLGKAAGKQMHQIHQQYYLISQGATANTAALSGWSEGLLLCGEASAWDTHLLSSTTDPASVLEEDSTLHHCKDE